jgi:hypothetical protein
MKTFGRLYRCGMIFFLAGAVLIPMKISSAEDLGSGVASPMDPPAFLLEQCVQVQKLIQHNPASPMPNSFLLVTQYEERTDQPEAPVAPRPDRAMNMYLVISVLVPPENQEIGIAQGMGLIVKLSAIDPESSTETVREWILIDNDGDAKIDGGLFRETVNGKGQQASAAPNEIAFPEDRLQTLQIYYERASQALDRKAELGPDGGCKIG